MSSKKQSMRLTSSLLLLVVLVVLNVQLPPLLFAAEAKQATGSHSNHRTAASFPSVRRSLNPITRNTFLSAKDVYMSESDTRRTTTCTTTNTESSNTSLLVSAGGAAASQWSSVQKRVVAATVLLAGLATVVYTGKEFGLQLLLWTLTPGLFYEATAVVLQADDGDNNNVLETSTSTPSPPNAQGASVQGATTVMSEVTATLPTADGTLTAAPTATVSTTTTAKSFTNKWWWFVAYTLGLSSQTNHLVSIPDQYLPAVHLISFLMIVSGLIHMVTTLNKRQAEAVDFKRACQELGVIHLGVVLTLVPATVWMAAVYAFGKEWVLYAALLVVINDTAAYIFGKNFGKHALLPTISPNKTWEGWLGALGSTLALSYPLWNILFSSTPYDRHALVLAIYCAVVAPFGGFLASTVKRAYGKKDFGKLIAGHGGLIDRLDCQLVTAPFVYLYLMAAKGGTSAA